MPPSRIAFAIGGLMTEVRGLMERDATIKAELRLDPNSYTKVMSELTHHYGRQLPRQQIVRAGGSGEFIVLGGLRISTMLTAPEGEDA